MSLHLFSNTRNKKLEVGRYYLAAQRQFCYLAIMKAICHRVLMTRWVRSLARSRILSIASMMHHVLKIPAVEHGTLRIKSLITDAKSMRGLIHTFPIT